MSLQAEAARKAKDWTVGMAAYDQVLAKLKNVTSTPATDKNVATPEMDMNKKRKHSKVSESEGCGDADAGQSAKCKKKLKSSKEASMPEQDIASAAEEILNFADTAPLAGSSSRAVAVAVAVAEKAIVARASHLARFGRRRAGKNVQRYTSSPFGCKILRKALCEQTAAEPSIQTLQNGDHAENIPLPYTNAESLQRAYGDSRLYAYRLTALRK